jgi:benzoyl-CoA 2,3-dioxygenase component A
MDIVANGVVKQHLIDPEVCIHCNTCETTCPSGAITHDANYVVDAAKCTLCMECIQPCPTGAIDNWRTMPRAKTYSVEAQMGWDSLPDALAAAELALAPVAPAPAAGVAARSDVMQYGATLPPWSAAHPYTKLYEASDPVVATVTGNMRVTEVGRDYDTHHIVLDLGKTPFPVLEGQSIGIVPPGHRRIRTAPPRAAIFGVERAPR